MTSSLTTRGYLAGWAVVRALPEPVAQGLFLVGAELVYRRGGKSVRRLESNLRRVLGPEATDTEVAAVARAGMRSYARYWMEAFRLPSRSRTRMIASTHPYGLERVQEVLARGNGLVFALPHLANWDLAGAWFTGLGVPFTTVAERLEPTELFDAFVGFRESLGMEVLPLTGGDRPAFEVLEERLRAGGVVCLVADRDLTATGVEVSFFGAATKMPAGPALLALKTGAALIPAALSYDDGGVRGLHVHFGDELAHPNEGTFEERTSELTQLLADAFAAGIRRSPQDWHMLQRLWLDDLEPRAPSSSAGNTGDQAR